MAGAKRCPLQPCTDRRDTLLVIPERNQIMLGISFCGRDRKAGLFRHKAPHDLGGHKWKYVQLENLIHSAL